METEINIVEILKDKPQGTKLYSSACGKCKLEEVDDKSFKISFYNSKFGFMNGGEGYLDKNGKLYDDGECVVFPSKEMRDWRKFDWKKGDVLVNKDGDVYIIFERFVDDTYCSFLGKYYLWKECYNEEVFQMETSVFEKASDDDAQTYINNINKCFGGKLNRETLEIEKPQSEFKDGDIVVAEEDNYYDRVIFIAAIKDNIVSKALINVRYKDYEVHYNEYSFGCNRSLRLATDFEKQQLFDALAKEGKAWDAEKKQIVDLSKKCEFKPMDWCLMRDIRGEECFAWSLCQFAYQLKRGKYEAVGGMRFDECIPYNEETAHLLGTTDEWKGGEG